MFSQIFQNSQLCKYVNELVFVFLFVSVTTINKFVLSELKFTVPTVFQGWQTLSCVILLTILIKFNKVKNDLQILDGKALPLILPALVCFSLGIVAFSKALADLHVPIFLAITNLYHAILVFLIKKNELNNVSLRVCGSTGVFGTVIIIVICNSTSENTSPLLWLFAHIIFNLLYYLYLYKINLDISYTTQIYYRNFFSVILLFPISLYLDVLHLPSNRGWEFYAGCFSSGVLGTFLQVWTFKISTQPNHLQIECLAKVICSVIAYKIFFADIQKLTWVLVILNFLICAIFLKSTDQKTRNVKSEINLSLPPSHIRKSDSDLMLLV